MLTKGFLPAAGVWLLVFAVLHGFQPIALGQEIRANSGLADSPWPVSHRNGYAQASTTLCGPLPTDRLDIQTVVTTANGASPWTILVGPYADGSMVAWGATLTHVLKVHFFNEEMTLVDKVKIDSNWLDPHWNLLARADGTIAVPDPSERSILFFADARPGDARSPIARRGEIAVSSSAAGNPTLLNIASDGALLSFSARGGLSAVDPARNLSAGQTLTPRAGEKMGHNQFPVGPENDLYFVTNQRLVRMDWTGTAFREVWSADYDFRAGSRSGSGTTPTLLGRPEDPDHLVVVVDNHAPKNHLVAFWRNEIPPTWAGLPGQDRRIAGILELPLMTTDGTTQAVENSPCAWGYELVVARWNGLRPPTNPEPGVHKVRWDPDTDTLALVWSNSHVALNNVPTYSHGAKLVYGSGPRAGLYHFYGLDWATGETRLDVPLGAGGLYLDQGNQVVLLPDRSAVFGTLRGMVRIRPLPASP
jgi:hypothetical protein